MHQQIIALREQRTALIAKAKALIPRDRKQTLSDHDSAEFDVLMAQIDDLQDEINLSQPTEKHMRLVSGLATLSQTGDAALSDTSRQVRAFHNFLKFGMGGLSAEDRELMNHRAGGSDRTMIQAAQSVGTSSGGGYAVPDAAMGPLVEAVKQSGGLLAHATIVPSESGSDLPIPTDNETAMQGEIITENSAHNEADITFGQVILKSYLYSSKIVRVSIQLMDDAGFDFGAYVMRKLGERVGRITASHWVNGTGTGQPRGLVTAAGIGKTAAGTTAVTYDELVDAMHSVDPLYRGNGQWLMNDTTFSALRKLKDSQNRPLYGDLNVNAPATLLGRPVVIDNGMPGMTTGNKAILFGDLKTYYIRIVKGPRVLRLEERYADFAQLGFLAFLRADGNLVDGGGGSVKALKMA